MKKTLIALAALASVSAFAQSSVTISGSLNGGIQRSAGVTTLNSNQAAANNITFASTEDLGGGLSAFGSINVRFNPASGFNASNGSGTTSNPTVAATDLNNSNDSFAQNVVMGLKGAFGTVQAGRFTGVVQGPAGAYDPFGTDSVNGVGIMIANPAVRNNGQVAYTTPVVSGLSASIQATLEGNNTGANAGATQANQTGQEIAVNYAAGALNAMVGNTKPLTAAGAKTNMFAASYDLGMAKPSMMYAKTGTTKETVLAASIPFGAAKLKVGTKRSDAAGVVTTTNAVGVTYSLSKRTSLIADVTKANAGSNTGSNTYVGMRHAF